MTEAQFAESQPLEPGTLLEELPVFPLPNAVLFPHTLLPLHVFEPRYRALVEHAMGADRRFGIAMLEDGYEPLYYGAPPVHPVLCVGEIVTLQALPDGRSNVLLRGVARGRIVEELRTPYEFRVMKVRVEGSELGGRQGDALARELATVRQLFASLVARAPQMQLADADALFSPDADVEQVLDAIAGAIPADPKAKQALLTERNVASRAGLLAEVLAEAVGSSFGVAPTEADPG